MKENSIEEAIGRLEYVNRAYDWNNYYSRYDLDCIEILLSDYKRVLKENEELKDRIREHTMLISPYYVKENYIPKTKIEEILEKTDLEIKKLLESE